MSKESELWQFIAERLNDRTHVMLLTVASSSGSSPGRAGYKMAVAADGQLLGSIGGGVMEVSLVEQARLAVSEPPAEAGISTSQLIEQEHRKNSVHPSGMICSGKQTVISRLLTPDDLKAVESVINVSNASESRYLVITQAGFSVVPPKGRTQNSQISFEKLPEGDFNYCEKIGPKNELFIVGGGHCALALSEIASRLDFRISIFDDRPELNTIEKNDFADAISIVDGYERIGEMIPHAENVYVVVMTLGYKFDEIVIRALRGREFKYFGVLGSKAKMATLIKDLKNDGFPQDWLSHVRTPIGLPINSHSPEEIAVSIAAEIISVKNSS